MSSRKILLSWLLLLCASGGAAAQGADPVFEAKGAQPHRDYFNQLSFEHIDTLSGLAVLSFTDVELPGPPGLELRIQRTYTSGMRAGWTFGIEGLPMAVGLGAEGNPPPFTPDLPPRPLSDWLPEFVMANGSEVPTVWERDVSAANQAGRYRWVTTADFWRFDREERRLYLPDGRVCEFDSAGRLIRVRTPFSSGDGAREIRISYQALQIHQIVQDLGDGQQRVVTLTPTASGSTLNLTAGAISQTWSYEWNGTRLTSAQGPEGPPWIYGYDEAGTLNYVHTPGGAEIRYRHENHVFNRSITPTTNGNNIISVTSRVVRERAVSGAATAGTWTYDYSTGSDGSDQTLITDPDGLTRTQTSYTIIGPSLRRLVEDAVDSTRLLDYGLTRREVERWDGADWVRAELETRVYQTLPVTDYGDAVPRLAATQVEREGRTYTIEHTFSNPRDNFFEFHHPTSTVEGGGGLTRTTRRSYRHIYDYSNDLARYILGLQTQESRSASGDAVWHDRSWSHDDTGFVTAETTYGITTSFEPTAAGQNAAEIDGHGHRSSYEYSWGVVSAIVRGSPQLNPSGYLETRRSIRGDGAVASETQRGQTTTFAHDGLSRVTRVQPPAPGAACTLCDQSSAPTVSTYDNTTGRSVTVTRGQSWTRTDFDGFGRIVGTESSNGVRTTTRYDAQGRVTFESLPWGNGKPQIGTDREYDSLGRVTRETHPDGSFRRFAYGITVDGGPKVTITDEEGRDTVQEFRAFGLPSDARLDAVTVPTQQQRTWRYAYTALGNLRTVTAPDGLTRSWEYDDRNLLVAEQHPESGRTTYDYDVAGRLNSRSDARGMTFGYGYDALDRVREVLAGSAITTIDYPENSNLRSATSGGDVSSSFSHDNVGRTWRRVDVVRDRTLTTTYGYDASDRVRTIRYPSGLEITQVYDQTKDALVAVEDQTRNPGRQYARDMEYHPSGALTSVRLADGHLQTFTYDAQRYWPKTITSAKDGQGSTIALTYDTYDHVGNLTRLIDATGSTTKTHVYQYDALDRLTYASGPAEWLGAYDAHGNRTTAGGTSYDYEPNTLRLRQQDAVGFGYDPNGNLTTTTGPGEGRTFHYDAHNRLVWSNGPNGAASYEYDSDNLRKVRIVDGATFFYVHGLNGEILSEFLDQNGRAVPNRDYVYAGSRLIASVQPPERVTVPDFRVSLATPGVDFEAPASIPLVADVHVGAGQTVARVDFYSGRAKIGSSATAPYTFTFAPVGAGNYAFTARAVLTNGRVAFSTPLPIKVIRVGRPLGISFSPNPAREGETVTITVDALSPCGAIGFDFGWSNQPPGGPNETNDYEVDAVSTLPHVRTYNRWPAGTFTVRADGHGDCRNSVFGVITIEPANPRPVVSLTAPADGASFAHGTPITLSATATDPNGSVTRVDFMDGGAVIGSDTTSPYSVTWTNAAAGPHTITAVGVDNEGGTGTSAAANISVTHLTAITASPSPVATGQDVSFTVTGSSACTAVQINYGDPNDPVDPNNVITYAITGLPTTLTPPRRYALGGVKTVTAIGQGNCFGTVSTTLTVNANTPPTVSLTSPVNGTTVAGPATFTLSASASDSDGINRVEFLQNNQLIGSDTTAPYSLSWPNVAPGAYAITARAVDTLNGSTTTAAANVVVTNLGVISVSPSPGIAGQAASVTVNGVSAGCSSVEITYGDGAVITYANGTLPTTQTHTWASAGTYAVSVRGAGAGCTGTAATSHTVNTNTPPMVSLTSPASGTTAAGPATFTLSATASDTDGINRVEFYQGATLIGTDTTSPYSLSWPNVPPGVYSVTARAVDNLNGAATSAPATVTVTNLGVISVSPSPGIAGQAASVTVNGVSAGCSSVEITYGDGAVITYANGTLPTTQTHTWASAGTYAVSVRGAGAGCTGTAATSHTVNANTPPMVSLTSPANGTTAAGPATFTVSATATDSHGINRVEFYQGATLIGTDTTSPYSLSWSNVPPGVYSVTARAVDNLNGAATSAAAAVTVTHLGVISVSPTPSVAGQPTSVTVSGVSAGCSSVEITYGDGAVITYANGTLPTTQPHTWATAGTYTVSVRGAGASCTGTAATSHTVNTNPPPMVSLTAPANGASFQAPASITLTATASDPHGVNRVEFYNGGSLIDTDTTSPYSVVWSNVPAGSYSLTARAVDNYNAAATSAAAVVAVNNGQVSGVSVSTPTRQNQAATVTVTGTNPCGAVEINYGDGVVVTYPITQLPYSQTHTWTTGGAKTVVARGMGNCTAQAQTTANVNWKPTVSITSPVNGSTFIAPASFTIGVAASDADGSVASVAFYANGVYLGADSSAPWSFTWSNVPAGGYTLTAIATDNTGNTATSAGVGVTINAAGPSQVTSVVGSPNPAAVNQGIAVTVYGTNPCGALQMNWGDGNAPVYPITQLPYTFYYAWSTPGTKTIIATGMGNCSGQVATTVTITP